MIKSSHFLSFLLIFILLIFSCQNKTIIDENKMNIIGNIEGLRKGDVYLQKVDNGLIINVDSVKIKGNSNFILNSKICISSMHCNLLMRYRIKIDMGIYKRI